MKKQFQHFIEKRTWNTILRRALFGGVVLIIISGLMYSSFFGPIEKKASREQYVIAPGTSVVDLAYDLKSKGIIKSPLALRIALSSKLFGSEVRGGAYEVGRGMDTWAIAETLASTPYLAYVSFDAGLRKEQIAHLLQKELSWSRQEKEDFLKAIANSSSDFQEGTYYPGVYLIAADVAPAEIAKRMRDKFLDEFEPYAKIAKEKGINWKDVVILASLIEREAGRNDKALVSGILWNRLDHGMRLQVDASLQYIKGNEGLWWPIPRSEDKFLSSPFNTYQHVGLPPEPISNPGTASIAAAVSPEETNCLYYLHAKGQIYCSANYGGHKANINRYLK